MRSSTLITLLAVGCLAVLSSVAVAQQASPLPSANTSTVTRVHSVLPVITRSGHKVYTYVEQMPQLPGGKDMPMLAMLVQAVQSRIRYPKAVAGEALPSGRAFVTFVVDADGTVQDAKIAKGLSPAFDAAVVAAVKELPRFEPGKQAGQPVAVVFTLPVDFKAKP
jgi:TonB family protein